ncbi:MAG: SDR family oxidoreductase [Bermanella sp.]
MTTLVVGASGATGRLVVEQLLNAGEAVKIIVRSLDAIGEDMQNNPLLTVTQADLLSLTDAQLIEQAKGCQAVVSCLGHNLTFKGLFGSPRRLVRDAVMRLCQAIEHLPSSEPVKFILMNTTGNQNKQAGETINAKEACVMSVLRCLLPPHVDNEQAAAFLQNEVGLSSKAIQWVVVRPDGLIDEQSVSPYKIYPSPIRSAIFDAGKTSRINVAHFMSQLVLDDECSDKWQGQMPVIYNA